MNGWAESASERGKKEDALKVSSTARKMDAETKSFFEELEAAEGNVLSDSGNLYNRNLGPRMSSHLPTRLSLDGRG